MFKNFEKKNLVFQGFELGPEVRWKPEMAGNELREKFGTF